MSHFHHKKQLLALQRLLLTENGLVFDPVSGKTFTVNETGLMLLRLFKEQASVPSMVRQVKQIYNLEPHRIKHEIMQFDRWIQDALL